MPAFRSRIIIVAVFLLSFSSSFASIIYVNINNLTPGTGTTWASAYNDLNLALAAANSYDQVWVAKGTYYPTTTPDRTITFNINKALSLYGGFNGTETVVTMANPAANPTILSGDIGMPGDPSDNSYHVVTFSTPATANFTMDGFTITGGNANLNYPASTTPSPDNTGGGLLELSITGWFQSAAITHCNFVSNFAVYGGGFGAYGDGIIVQHSIISYTVLSQIIQPLLAVAVLPLDITMTGASATLICV